MKKIIHDDPYQTLVNFDGLYESPVDKNGKYKGPLVAYAGIEPVTQKNYVGFAYFNIAKIEQDPESRYYFTGEISNIFTEKINEKPHVVIGAPMGGIIFAVDVADFLNARVGFFEKKVIKLADPENRTREISELVLNRHDIWPEDNVIIFEDLCNNFSTTDKMIDLIKSKGAKVIAIACIFNRSALNSWRGIPVISVIHKHTPEYAQTDPEVIELIQSGNIIWKPKVEWSRLKEAMERRY